MEHPTARIRKTNIEMAERTSSRGKLETFTISRRPVIEKKKTRDIYSEDTWRKS